MENKNTQNNELLKWIHERSHDMVITHTNAFFTFLGFIITIISALLGFNEKLGDLEKRLLFLSIVSIVIGVFFYFMHSRKLIELTSNMYSIVARHTDNNTNPRDELSGNKLPYKYECIGIISEWLQYTGVVLFIIALTTITFH